MIHAMHLVWIKLLAALGFFLFGMSTTGSITPSQPTPQDFTGAGGVSTFPFGTGISAATLIKSGPGRLMKILVTTSAAEVVTFYDTTNISTQTGATIVGYVPASAPAGTIYDLRMPLANGLVVVPAGAGVGLTVSYS